MSEGISIAVGQLAGRLANFLAAAFPQPDGAAKQSLAFLRAAAAASSGLQAQLGPRLDRLIAKLSLGQAEIDLLLLAGMPEEHEGYAAVFRTLHPRNEPRPSLGLAAQLFGANRHVFLQEIESRRVIRNGAVRIKGVAPLFERSLEPEESLWPVLHGSDAWPSSLPHLETAPCMNGLEDWLRTRAVSRACAALSNEDTCTVLFTADSDETAFHRGVAATAAAGRQPAAFLLSAPLDPDLGRTLKVHSLARGTVPILRMAAAEGPSATEIPSFDDFPDTSVICGRTGAISLPSSRPLIAVVTERLEPQARQKMWSSTLPKLSDFSGLLAARHPIEPAAAAEVAADLGCMETLEGRAGTVADVGEIIRARGALALSGGVKLIRPTASWDQLVVSRDREEQLRAAGERLGLQARVLDDWGFLKGRAGARGVRMLFSGPPGTGKTLSAEVLAGELNVDLLLVDISRVVSKWIGETEKNLAAVFDMAERAQAVTFFDEADGLFGRRTEVSDAHDRYANLETAYLLARLERFDGLAILATNLRHNIDPAFLRRMDFVIDFEEPNRQERCRLWRCHIPDPKLLDSDVNLDELATLYPVVGAFIRNAAVAAAFLAAADGGKITRNHCIRAIRREYDKAGQAFPGMPAGMKNC